MAPRDLLAPKQPRDLFSGPAEAQPDWMGQFLSGANEGVGNLLSLPNTVELGLRSIGPGIGNAMGGDFAMPTDSWLPNVGESYFNLANNIGAIKPETGDVGDQFARRVGEEVGAGIIPWLGAPGKVAGAASIIGSGVGAGAAEYVAPDNPYAEIIGQLIGGGIPVGIGNAAERSAMQTAAPTLDELRTAKSAAYKAVDNLGVQYTPQAVDDLIARMNAAGAKINPMRHQKAASVLDDIKGLSGQPQTLTQLDELRQVIRRDLLSTPDGGEKHWGRIFRDELDDFIASAQPGQMLSGDPVAATEAINNARLLNTRYKKVEDFEGQMTKAERATNAAGSGGNINNQIRSKANQILGNPKRSMGYSQEEMAALEAVVAPGKGEDLLRGIGKLAPGGNGLMTALNTGAVVHNPALAVIPAVAQVAKMAADKGTRARADVLRALLANGGKMDVPWIAPESEQVLRSLMTTQAANQNDPTMEIARLLALN